MNQIKNKASGFSNQNSNNKPNSTSKYKSNQEEGDFDLNDSENIREIDEDLNHEVFSSKNFEPKSKNNRSSALRPSNNMKQDHNYVLNTRKLSDVKLINASGKSPMLSNGSQTVFIPPKISQGKPILLIEKSQFGLALTQEAIEEISKYDLKTSIVSIIGEKRSGKSLLLNKLLDISDDKGFDLENSEGLWMWNVPYYHKKENRLIFFAECSEFTKNEGDDAFFGLVFSISSVIIFNVMGEFNDKTMTIFSLIGSLSRIIQDIKKIRYPLLFWTFRDVNEKTLKQIIEGNYSQSQILETKLNDFLKKNYEIKKNINDFFPENSTFHLPKALETKNIIKKEFLKAIEPLKTQIEKDTFSKILFETALSARMLLTFINSALETIREKNVIDLAICWNCVIENECITAYNDSIDLYNLLMKEFFIEDEPRKPEDIFHVLQSIRDVTLEKFNFMAGIKEKNEFYQTYQNKLKEFINVKELKTIDINEQMNSEKSEMLFQDLAKKIEIDINKGVFHEKNIGSFISQLNDLLETYSNYAQGLSKSEILVKNFKELNEGFLQTFIEKLSNKDNKHNEESQNLNEIKHKLNAAVKEKELADLKVLKSHEILNGKEEEISKLKMTINSLKHHEQSKKSGGFWCCGKKK